MARKSTLGSLLINLELQTATLNKQVGTINKKFNSMTKTFKTVGAALAGAFAVRGIKDMVNSSLKLNDALGKTADRLGINVEVLQGLRFGAEQSGVGIATLEMALQRMTRRVSEAANGTGEAVKALKEMGIEAEDIASLSVDEQLNVLADALSGVENEADQVRLAMKLFDSEGVKLLNMLKDGSAGLSKYQKEAQDLGFVLSRDMIARMEQANDSMNRASKVGGVFSDMLATAVAPAISVVAEQFVTFVKNSNTGSEALQQMQGVVSGLVKGFDILVNALKTSATGWGLTIDAIVMKYNQWFGSQEELRSSTEQFFQSLESAEKATNNLFLATLGLSDTQVKLKQLYAETPKEIEKSIGATTKLIKANKDAGKEFKNIQFVFTNAFSNMENSIIQITKTGKASFKDFANAILEDLLRMIIRLQITIPLMQSLQAGMGGGVFGGGFAQGGAFVGGVQKFATGGVVSSPTNFPMAGGKIGLMGEAGAEAIMPLTRTSGGDLGVKAIVSSNGTVVNIYNQSGAEAEVTESTGAGGEKTIDVMIRNSVERNIGNGSLDSAFSSNFGLSRRGY